MAYREFHNEQYFEAPDLSAIDRGAAMLGSMLAANQKRKQAKASAVNQFAYDLDKGAYENDTNILKDIAIQVTSRAKQELMQDGRISQETDRLMKEGTAAQQASQNQLKRADTLLKTINDKESKDPYYNSEPDIKLVTRATHGDNNDIDFRTRGETLSTAEKQIGGIDTFRYDKYRADYIKQIGQQYKETEFPLKSGGSKTRYDQAVFWDKSGKPGVTDQHAINFLESDKRVDEWFNTKVSRELDQEIKSMKASGDSRAAWMKGMSDADIKNELINDPSKNLLNQNDYGVRIRDKAKSDLQEADRINSKVSYTGMQKDENNSGGRWKNPNILHDQSINSFAQEARSVDGHAGTVTTFGPGGRFTQKNGKALQVDTANPIRTDIRKGITTRNNKGSMKLNMTGYQLMPVKLGMGPMALRSNTTEGMIEEINNIPLDFFDPEGKVKLQPDLRIGLNGYTVNEAGVLNDIQDQLFSLADQLHAAEASNDKEKIASLQNMEYNLNELKEMVGSGDYDPQDLLLAGNKAGVRKIQQDWIIPADNSDLATIKNVTGGFDLNNKSYWSEDMLAVDEAYRKRAAEAKVKGYGKTTEPPVSKTTTTVITSDGSDVEQWKRTTEYKVGNSVYYFDKSASEWKKK